ncbi:hypothetical protein PpBr36_07617 [Pyricularia pennisetigena]|uniref:hypothetical protein n=1 Tax=Pyricularia pennisetigena TaxID=1578925 RepID=UPI001153DD65|nr:hypothetical protein PpBr36_07617 [Pyricularia pennisetigena]TLS25661.1 hypothetical protein PpBr36_07617 [Pyricularia pennisetigena]
MTGITPDLMDQGPDPDFHVFMVLGLAGLKGNGIEQTVQNQLQAIDTHLSQRTRKPSAHRWKVLGSYSSDAEGHSQLEIRKVYYECIQKLYSDITTKPSDRRLLQTTNLLQNELAVVHDVVETQARVIRGLAFTSRSADSWGTRTRVSGRDGDYVKLTHAPVRDQRQQSRRTEYTHRYQQILDEPQDAWVERLTVQGNPDRPSHTTKWQYGLKTWFIRDIERISSRDSQQYTHLVGYVRDLGETIEAEVNVTKDHQELAIYAFTIVTIVFLPLSSVASIFGMNTADIREMEVGQWLYWAVALPVTASVILLGLWWMGKLDSINKLSGRWSSVMTVKTGTEGSEASHNDFLPSSRQYRISSPPPELDDFIVAKPGQISRATYRASGATGVEAEHHRYRQSTGNFSRQRSGSVLQRAAESSRTMPLWIP